MQEKLNTLTTGLTELNALFTTFAAEHRLKIPGLPVFEQGVESYAKVLTLNADQVIKMLEDDLGRIRSWIADHEKQRQLEINA